ncbi:MAG: phosphate ABC transporter ATP-binding protein [Syntrophobacteraceae bacterium]|nr:phosphate ABC transporter ATP-binding protein [Syntrophobacteraceae bacterium]
MANPMSPKAEATVEVSDLNVHFSGKTVLAEVAFTLWPGEITVIVGPSGSGKTTLLRSLNRLNECFPECDTKGAVRLRFDARCGDIYKDFLPLPALRRRVGMIFQNPAVLPFSIWKNLTMPLRVTLGLTGAALAERAERALQNVSLWDEVKDRIHDAASTLSGGQQQRLCLARVLALEPRILLLDEPTASLDFRAAARIEELLLELKDQYTILAVSHSLSETRRLADRVLVLREGRIVQELDRQHLSDPAVFQQLIEAAF